MDESFSYSPSEQSSEHQVECSQVSLRSVGSQMSISTAGSVQPPNSTYEKRIHKHFGFRSNRRKRGKMTVVRKLKYPKASTMSTEISVELPCSPVLIIPESYSSDCNSNVVLNIAVFKEVLDSMAKCSRCDSWLELAETGTSSDSASFQSLKCTSCESLNKFWSVGGYSHGKLSIGHSDIPKRNSIVYSSVLAGRLMGIGWHQLFLYHSMLNIPGPVTSRNFRIVQGNILVAAEATAIECMHDKCPRPN